MSPNETGPPRETGKHRTGRIQLDYYKTPDALSRTRFWLTAAAAVVAVAWMSGLGLNARPWSNRSERTLAMVSPGPLAKVHATWDAECESCHVPFIPIDGSAWTARFVPHARDGDTHCKSCHDAPGHHEDKASEAAGSCASCHRDHRGREVSLVTVADQDCTRCHAALTSHVKSGSDLTVAPSVTRFGADRSEHPEVALFRDGKTPRDPGRVEFNHALHMTRGLPKAPGGVPLKTLADLPDGDRGRYRAPGQKDTDAVQLRCDTCHRADGDRGPGFGPLMKPVRYENDCRACHPLDYDPAHPPLAHHLTPAEVDAALWQSFSADFLRAHPELKGARPTFRAIPGHTERRPEIVAAQKVVGDKVARAETLVFGKARCAECHHYVEGPGEGREVASLAAWDPAKDVRIAPTNVNADWFKHASFDHSAHTAVSCKLCHEQAYSAAARTSADVMLPKIAVCQSCHAPREKTTATSVTGGAGVGCSECHRYHGASATGSLALDGSAGSDLQQFLLGTLRKKGK